MALQVRARGTRRDTESQELLLGDGTSLRLEMGRDKLGYCRSQHLGAAMQVLWCSTHIWDRKGGAPRLWHSRGPSYWAKQESGVRAAGTCITSPWYSRGTGEL